MREEGLQYSHLSSLFDLKRRKFPFSRIVGSGANEEKIRQEVDKNIFITLLLSLTSLRPATGDKIAHTFSDKWNKNKHFPQAIQGVA